VAVSYSFEQLISEAFDNEWVHSFFFAEDVHKFFEIVLQILKYEYEFAIGMNYFSEIDYIDMVQFFEN